MRLWLEQPLKYPILYLKVVEAFFPCSLLLYNVIDLEIAARLSMTRVHVKRVAAKKKSNDVDSSLVLLFFVRVLAHLNIATQTANEMSGRTKCDALYAYVLSHIQFKIGAMALAFFVWCVSRHTNPMCAKTSWLHLLSDGYICTHHNKSVWFRFCCCMASTKCDVVNGNILGQSIFGSFNRSQ